MRETMRIAISSGHSTKCPGASDIIDEVTEATKVVNTACALRNRAGIPTVKFHDTVSTTSSENLERIVNWHNAQKRDYDISVHFNAYQHTTGPMGTECLYITQKELSDRMAEAIATAADLIDRGPKYRSDLYVLNNTDMPCILIEVCFVDSQADVDIYHRCYDDICSAIAGVFCGDSAEKPPPQPERPVPIPPPRPPGSNIVALTVQGDVIVYVNGQCIDTNGDDEPDHRPGQFWHQEITATVFGAGDDAQETAYGGRVDDHTAGIALPYKFTGDRPNVIVQGPRGQAVCPIIDVGPWNTNDPGYVQDTARPLAEKQYASGTQAQNGQVPKNDAGIDLAPMTAKQIGVDGKGKVRWRYL